MDPKQHFAKVVDQTGLCIRLIQPDQLTNATPCSEWDLRALLNHMVSELLWMPPLLMGKTIAEVGNKFDGDVLTSDYISAWQRAADGALVAVKHADLDATVHLSYGDLPARNYINDMITDVLIHGWDVGQSMKCSVIFDVALAQAAYDHLEPNMVPYRNSGFVGEPVEVPPDAGIQTRLLAMMGRKEHTA